MRSDSPHSARAKIDTGQFPAVGELLLIGPRLRNGLCVPDFGYADDFALLATTPADLQRLIDAAVEFCEQTKMVVSTDKTKVVVF